MGFCPWRTDKDIRHAENRRWPRASIKHHLGRGPRLTKLPALVAPTIPDTDRAIDSTTTTIVPATTCTRIGPMPPMALAWNIIAAIRTNHITPIFTHQATPRWKTHSRHATRWCIYPNQMNDPETNKNTSRQGIRKSSMNAAFGLLGDMRVTTSWWTSHLMWRITSTASAVLTDQQSYEGRKNLYLLQFFKENFCPGGYGHENTSTRIDRTVPLWRKNIDHLQAGLRYRMKELLWLCEERYHLHLKGLTSWNLWTAANFNTDIFLKCNQWVIL